MEQVIGTMDFFQIVNPNLRLVLEEYHAVGHGERWDDGFCVSEMNVERRNVKDYQARSTFVVVGGLGDEDTTVWRGGTAQLPGETRQGTRCMLRYPEFDPSPS